MTLLKPASASQSVKAVKAETARRKACLQVQVLHHLWARHGLVGVNYIPLLASPRAAHSIVSQLEGQLVRQRLNTSAVNGLHLCIHQALGFGCDLQEGSTISAQELRMRACYLSDSCLTIIELVLVTHAVPCRAGYTPSLLRGGFSWEACKTYNMIMGGRLWPYTTMCSDRYIINSLMQCLEADNKFCVLQARTGQSSFGVAGT